MRSRVGKDAEFLNKRRIRRLGLEADHVTWQHYLRLSRALSKALLEPTVGVVEGLRIIKAPWEIALIKRALRAAEKAFRELRGGIRPGMTEKQAADQLETLMRKAGAERAGFDTIVAFDAHGSLPHARPGKQAFR